MVRLPLLLTAAAAAVAAAVTPAIAGLTGNPSFSEQLPVQVPSRANTPSFPTRPVTPAPVRPASPTATHVSPTAVSTVPAPSSTDRREPEPGDDGHRRGGRGHGTGHGGGSGHRGGRDG